MPGLPKPILIALLLAKCPLHAQLWSLLGLAGQVQYRCCTCFGACLANELI